MAGYLVYKRPFTMAQTALPFKYYGLVTPPIINHNYASAGHDCFRIAMPL